MGKVQSTRGHGSPAGRVLDQLSDQNAGLVCQWVGGGVGGGGGGELS